MLDYILIGVSVVICTVFLFIHLHTYSIFTYNIRTVLISLITFYVINPAIKLSLHNEIQSYSLVFNYLYACWVFLVPFSSEGWRVQTGIEYWVEQQMWSHIQYEWAASLRRVKVAQKFQWFSSTATYLALRLLEPTMWTVSKYIVSCVSKLLNLDLNQNTFISRMAKKIRAFFVARSAPTF